MEKNFEEGNYHIIKIRLIDSIKLFLLNYFSIKICKCIYNKKIQRLYNKGTKKIDKELDIVKVLTTLRNIKILMKNSIMSKQVLK